MCFASTKGMTVGDFGMNHFIAVDYRRMTWHFKKIFIQALIKDHGDVISLDFLITYSDK